jgi:ribosome biogenesis protein Nip4
MYRPITPAEKEFIDSTLRKVCGKDSNALWPKKILIVVKKKQNHVFALDSSVFNLLQSISEKKSRITGISLEYACNEIGILTKTFFRVGLEVIQELATYVKDRLILDEIGETAFLFGKDISRKNVLQFPKNLREGDRFIVFSKHNYPLGLAQLEIKSKNKSAIAPLVINLIDYGYYLRSGG